MYMQNYAALHERKLMPVAYAPQAEFESHEGADTSVTGRRHHLET